MDILVAGGHGQVARRLLRLAVARGPRARGLIRNPGHAGDLEALGAEPVLCDLETDDPRPHLRGAGAVVFAAGAGPGSGAERKRTVDLGGAVKLMEAAADQGVRRYVIVSSMGYDDLEHADPAMRPYYEAKRDADAALRESGLDWTIVKPGRLTDGAGTGRVDAAPSLGRRGEIAREDVAATLLECLEVPAGVHAEFELLAGDTPIPEAVRALAGGPAAA
jgi:uncharacterized protein YbjT (DUF2867 family)